MIKNILNGIVDFEKSFNSTVGARIMNNLSELDGRTLDDYTTNLFSVMDSEFGFAASCECGEHTGNFYEGHTCSFCGTVVSSQFTSNLSNTNWIGIPDEMPPVIHPIFYSIFRECFGKTSSTKGRRTKKVPIIQAILDPSSELPEELKKIVPVQGFGYFYHHHEEIIDFLLNFYKYRTAKTNKNVRHVYEKDKDKLFTRRLPIMHPTLHPIMKKGRIKSIDETSNMIMPVITDMSALVFSASRGITTKRNIERSLWNNYSRYIEYISVIITNKFGGKFAQIRRHNIGARAHFTSRAVITPLIEAHMGDEIHAPWDLMLIAYKCEILNLLCNRNGYSDADAESKFRRALMQFDQEIYDVIMTIMEEWGYKGFPIIIGRNPTLIRGAIQLCYITKVYTDVNIKTFAISPRIVKAPNAKNILAICLVTGICIHHLTAGIPYSTNTTTT